MSDRTQKILIVDDDREFCSRALKQSATEDYVSLKASNGQEGVRISEKGMPRFDDSGCDDGA